MYQKVQNNFTKNGNYLIIRCDCFSDFLFIIIKAGIRKINKMNMLMSKGIENKN